MEYSYQSVNNMFTNYQVKEETLLDISDAIKEKTETSLSLIPSTNFSYYINTIFTEGIGYEPSFYNYDSFHFVDNSFETTWNSIVTDKEKSKTILNKTTRDFLLSHYYLQEQLLTTATSIPVYSYVLDNRIHNLATMSDKIGYQPTQISGNYVYPNKYYYIDYDITFPLLEVNNLYGYCGFFNTGMLTEEEINKKMKINYNIPIENMEYCFERQQLLTHTYKIPKTVKTMAGAYQQCVNLLGPAICGNSVENMSHTYSRCVNLTGSPVCGPNVIDFSQAYQYCNNITGIGIVGNNVVNAWYSYAYCFNLSTGIISNNCIDLSSTFYLCPNIKNYYIFSNRNDISFGSCCRLDNYHERRNFFIYPNSYLNDIFIHSHISFFGGDGMKYNWIFDNANNCYYNTEYNLYIYYNLDEYNYDDVINGKF